VFYASKGRQWQGIITRASRSYRDAYILFNIVDGFLFFAAFFDCTKKAAERNAGEIE
jgi:hypothetical protein